MSVCGGCTSRTTIDIDDELCQQVMDRYRLPTDCLIGAVAIRADAEVLHADSDFATLARHTDLRVHEASQR